MTKRCFWYHISRNFNFEPDEREMIFKIEYYGRIGCYSCNGVDLLCPDLNLKYVEESNSLSKMSRVFYPSSIEKFFKKGVKIFKRDSLREFSKELSCFERD